MGNIYTGVGNKAKKLIDSAPSAPAVQPNVLVNGDFRINQNRNDIYSIEGNTSTTDAEDFEVYIAEQWKVKAKYYPLEDDVMIEQFDEIDFRGDDQTSGLLISAGPNIGNNVYIFQVTTLSRDDWRGMPSAFGVDWTLSVSVDGNIYTTSANISDYTNIFLPLQNEDPGYEIEVEAGIPDGAHTCVYIHITGEVPRVPINWVKLERSPQFTGYLHPDYALEQIRCNYFFRRVFMSNVIVYISPQGSNNAFQIKINYPIEKMQLWAGGYSPVKNVNKIGIYKFDGNGLVINTPEFIIDPGETWNDPRNSGLSHDVLSLNVTDSTLSAGLYMLCGIRHNDNLSINELMEFIFTGWMRSAYE